MIEREGGYTLELLRSELKAALAEQMVQLVDRFASKGDLADLRNEMLVLERQTNGRFNVIDEKLDTLVNDKLGRDVSRREHAEAAASAEKTRSRRLAWWTLALTVFAALVGSLATLVWLALSG